MNNQTADVQADRVEAEAIARAEAEAEARAEIVAEQLAERWS